MIRYIISALILLALIYFAPVKASTINRGMYAEQCRTAGIAAGNKEEITMALCNCASQLISTVMSKTESRNEDFNIDAANPIINSAVQSCITIAESSPWKFMKYFGTVGL